ncbi:hypothetical protein BSLA_02f5042 [Burkholderia stabilis]|nr:hypothetical protein BSLA_02f5042 [Burkholderia stabilis]
MILVHVISWLDIEISYALHIRLAISRSHLIHVICVKPLLDHNQIKKMC